MATKNFYVKDGLKVKGNTLLNGATYSDTPLSKLHVKSAANGASANLNNVNGLIIENSGSSNTNYALKLATGAGNILSVTNAGRVGIGTITPNVSGLTVVGDISASGNIYGDIADLEFTDLTVTGDLSVTGDSYFAALSSSSIYNTGDIVTVGDVEADEFIGSLRGAVTFKAQAGEAISKGDVVYISGLSGNTTVVSKADADDANKMPAFGIAQAAASLNTPVTIVNFGSITNINTSSFPEGTELFVGTTAGALVSAAPTGETSAIQKIAKVTRQDATVGSMTVMGAGRSNAVSNLNEGRLFVGNSSNQAVADGTIHVDIANSRVGIGTTSPLGVTEITGAGTGGRGLRITETSSSKSNGVYTLEVDSSAHGSNTSTAGAMKIDVAGGRAVTVDGQGRTGIGTTNPNEKLTVSGNISASGTVYADAFSSVTGGDTIDFNDNLHLDGNLTVNGTISGNDVFTIGGGGTSGGGMKSVPTGATDIYGLKLSRSNTARSSADIWDASSDSIIIGTTDSDTTFTVTSGFVGIGITNPTHNLSVDGTVGGTLYSSSYIEFPASGGDAGNAIIKANDDVKIGFCQDFVVKQSGNVGIGKTNPDSILDVNDSVDGGALELILNNSAAAGSTDEFTNIRFRHAGKTGAFIKVGREADLSTTANTDNFMALWTTQNDSPSEKLRITSTGNVGIGITNPSSKLHIVNSANSAFLVNTGAGTGYTYLRSTNTGGEFLLGINRSDGVLFSSGLAYATSLGTTGSTALQLHTNNNPRVTIDTNGRVGIGTTDIRSKLFIAGGGIMLDYGNGGSTDGAALRINSNSNEAFLQTNAYYSTAVKHARSGASSKITFRLDATRGGDITFTTAPSAAADANMSQTEVMTIKQSGNVGIGTTDPDFPLEVAGAIGIDDYIYHNGDHNTYIQFVSDAILLRTGGQDRLKISNTETVINDDTLGHDFRVEGDTDTALFITDASTDRVGIGTTNPIGKFHIKHTCNSTAISGVNPALVFNIQNSSIGADTYYGNIRWGRPNSNGGTPSLGIIARTDDSNPANIAHLAFYTEEGTTGTLTERMVIENGGNVGIGTTNPSNKLQVVGGATSVNLAVIGAGEFTSNDFGTTFKTTNTNQKRSQIFFKDSADTITSRIGNDIEGANNAKLQFIAGSGSTPHMSILSGGNVGIGTTSPDSLLHISSTSSSCLTIQNTTNAGCAGLYLRDEGGTDQFKLFYDLGNNASCAHINGNGLTLYSTQVSTEIAKFGLPTNYTAAYFKGDVGIGTDSPSGLLHLQSDGGDACGSYLLLKHANNNNNDIIGTIEFANNLGKTACIQAGTTGHCQSGYISFSTELSGSASEVMRITEDSKVGIGTTSPYGKLEVAISPTTSSTTVNETADFADKFVISNAGASPNFGDRIPLVFNVGADGADHISAAIVGERETSGWNTALSFWVNNVTSGTEGTDAIQEGMRLNSDGNLGIGTTDPNALIHISGTSNGTQTYGRFSTGSLNGDQNLYIQSGSNRDHMAIQVKTGAGANDDLSLNPEGGNVGIGTASPNEKLTVSGNISASGIVFADAFCSNSGSSNTIDFNDNLDVDGCLVTSEDAYINSVRVGRGAGCVSGNTVVGDTALGSNTTGTGNSAFGHCSLCANTTGNYNTAVGKIALCANTTGSNNVAVGFRVLRNNTASSNTAVGTNAMYTNTTGTLNTAVGKNALFANTTGSCNTALGHYSLSENTTGESNSALGHNALRSNTTGGCNAAFGQAALCSNTTGQQNTALGRNAMCSNSTGSYNAAVGQGSLASNTTGVENNAFGWGAMGVNTTGAANTASGHYALFTNSTGCRNTAHGWKSLYANTTGSCNTAVGRDALGSNTVGTNNIGIGYQAAHLNTVASNNVAVGLTALYYNRTGTRNTAIGTYAAHKTCNINDITVIGYSAAFCNTTGAGNTVVGSNSLYANTTGASNSALGHNALRCNTTASNNVATGKAALQNNTTGASNTASGTYSLYKNTIGADNAAFGTAALQNNTTGNYNVAVGRLSMFGNTIGDQNTAVGYSALRCNTTGKCNVAVGTNSLYANTSGSANTSVGRIAMRENTTGSCNTAIGFYSLYNNTTGNYNTASGIYSLKNNTTGFNNAAFGANSLCANTTGNTNTALGNAALRANTTGHSNTAAGEQALYVNTTGNYNTAHGKCSLLSNTTGCYNSALGYEASKSNTTGAYNTSLGFQTLFYNQTGGRNTGLGTYAFYKSCNVNDNTGVGYAAGICTTTGSGNTVAGACALYYNTTGTGNTATGYLSLCANTTGGYSTAVGFRTLRSNTTGRNTAYGTDALYTNSTGTKNTALGDNSLNKNTTGNCNTASGYTALYCNTTGSYNTASGFGALKNNTTANNNTASGFYSLKNNSTGYNNAAYGLYSLLENTTGYNNTAMGVNALFTNATSWENAAFGASALYANTTGCCNTAHGFAALKNNTTGLYNTALGWGSACSNTTGSSNVSIGWASLYQQTAGNSNTAIGIYSQFANNGSTNVSVGNETLMCNTTGVANTAVGFCALKCNTTGYCNTVLGYLASAKNTSGILNSGVGSWALYSNTSGARNSALGYASLHCNTTGINNTSTGYNSLYYNTTGGYNTATGYDALKGNTTGSFNAGFGLSVLANNSTGVNNVAMGTYALLNNTVSDNTTSGSYSLCANTTGSLNSAFGRTALKSNTTGTCNVAFGFQAACASTTASNTITIGANAVSCGSNTTVIGNSSTTDTYLCGTVHATCFTESSSLRYKCNIQDYSFDLDCIDKVRPVSYVTCSNSLSAVGYIAEEMNELYPEVVVKDNDNKPESINYARMVVILMEKVKDLQNQINILKESIA